MMILRIISIMLIGCFVLTIPATAVIMVGFGTGASGIPVAPTPAPTPIIIPDFVELSQSSLSVTARSNMSMVQEETGAGDVSGWTNYDVTCRAGDVGCTVETGNVSGGGGIVGFPVEWGCSAMVGDGLTDDSAAFNCMLNNIDDVATTACLVFTAGSTYVMEAARFETQVYKIGHGGRADGHNICFKSSVPLQKYSIKTNSVEGDDNNGDGLIDTGYTLAGTPVAGFGIISGSPEDLDTAVFFSPAFRGNTVITLTTAIAGLAAGDWLKLTSSGTGSDPDNGAIYRVKVRFVFDTPSGTTIVIDRPLPVGFGGTSITAAQWFPATGWHIEDLAMFHEYPEHQDRTINGLFHFINMADVTVLRSTFDGYQYGMSIEHSARFKVVTTDVTSSYDKPFNTYALIVSNSNDINLIDMHVSGSESFACAGDSQNILAAYMYAAAPAENLGFDSNCDYSTGNVLGQGGNLCKWSDVSSHTLAHGNHQTCTDSNANGECDLRTGESPIATGLATHCSTQELDMLGIGGSACRGVRSDVMAGSILSHNASCSNMVIARSHFEAGWWDDYFDGPGRYNTLFGSLGMQPAGRSVQFNGVSNGGDLSTKQLATQPTPSDAGYGTLFTYPPNYTKNTGVIGNNLNAIDMFDRMMHSGRFEHNIIRDRCVTGIKDNGDASLDELVIDCATETTSLPPHQQGYVTTVISAVSMEDLHYIPDTTTRNLIGATLWNRSTDPIRSCIITGHTNTRLTCQASMDWKLNDEWSIGGTNITWQNNIMSATEFEDNSGSLSAITLPSIPGLTSWPTLTVPAGETSTGTPPYVGADIAGPASNNQSQSCLPAFERYHNGCTQPNGTSTAVPPAPDDSAPSVLLARDQSSLEDLSVSADRVSFGYPADWYEDIDTSAWTVVNVSANSCDDNPTDNDHSAINTAITNAARRSVILLQGNCVYNLSGRINITRDLVVLRGAGTQDGSSTTLKYHGADGSPGLLIGLNEHRPNGNLNSGGARQSSVNWTGGYTRGTTVIQLSSVTGISVGSYLLLSSGYPTEASYEGDPTNSATNFHNEHPGFNYLAKVTDIAGLDVSIDRPLPADYSAPLDIWETGYVAGANNHLAYIWDNRIENVGVEDLIIVDSNPEAIGQNTGTFLEGAIHSWITGVVFKDHNSTFLLVLWSYRNLFRGNTFQDLHFPLMQANNHSAIVVNQSSDNVFENNAFLNQVPRGITFQLTATRNVFAYNFMDDPGVRPSNFTFPSGTNPASLVGTLAPGGTGTDANGRTYNLCHDLTPGGGGRSVFHHGGYTHSTIVEGNDATCKMELDIYWGRQGRYITYYRNRIRSGDGGSMGRIGTEQFGIHGFQQSYVNYIGNTSQYMNTNGNGNFALDDGDSFTHGEYNVIRTSCRLQQLSGNVDSQCASGNGAGANGVIDSPVPAAEATVWTNNHVGSSALSAWSSVNAPNSLVYSAPPSWWCQESCPFDGNTGIGAFGDDFTNGEASLCMLPAERWAKGLTCTPL